MSSEPSRRRAPRRSGLHSAPRSGQPSGRLKAKYGSRPGPRMTEEEIMAGYKGWLLQRRRRLAGATE